MYVFSQEVKGFILERPSLCIFIILADHWVISMDKSWSLLKWVYPLLKKIIVDISSHPIGHRMDDLFYFRKERAAQDDENSKEKKTGKLGPSLERTQERRKQASWGRAWWELKRKEKKASWGRAWREHKREENRRVGAEPGENFSVLVLTLTLIVKVLRRWINWYRTTPNRGWYIIISHC